MRLRVGSNVGASVDFRILGQLEVVDDGTPIEVGSPRQRALLARLLISANEIVSTDRLVDDLWTSDPPETARHTLHVYVSRLRKAFGDQGGRLQHEDPGYRLTVETDELDASRFVALAADGRAARARGDPEGAAASLSDALLLWRGPALADVADEPFARGELARLEELRLDALEDRLWADLALGRHNEVVEELRELTARHPMRETFPEQLMLALYRSDRQVEALRVYQAVRSTLAMELGIEPGPALQRLEERILAHDPALGSSVEGTIADSPAELPLQRTSFVGRHRELALGAELLGNVRLLTLTGAPGSGKTRLALRLAAEHADMYPDGVFFVPLAPLTDPRHCDAAVARVLGLAEVPGESALEGLEAFLARRRVLLILDNFEHLLEAAPMVGRLVDAAPELTIVVTSRSPLGLSGEQEFPVPPLAVPPLDPDLEVGDLRSYDAVALFVARCLAVDPTFELDETNADDVSAITVRLDGLPLAIELAAARIRLLEPAELRTRLEHRLKLLTESPADVDERHRTMRSAITWSYELLDSAEQALFRRLGVFLGGFTLDAAAAVADLNEEDALDHVGALLSKSLLYRPVDVGQARFSMLEMTRELALEELAAADETGETASRHATYFVRLAEEVEPLLSSEPGGTGAARLALEVDNLRAALRHSLEDDHPDLGLQLAGSIWRYWQSSDQLIEGREWLERLLGHPQASDDARAKGLTALAGLAYWMADYDEALLRYESALDLYRDAGDRFNEADTLYGMSLTAGWKGDLEQARRFAADSERVFEQVGSREGMGRAMIARAFVLWRCDDLHGARDLWEEALAIAREAGDVALASTQLVGLASLTLQLGEPDEAMRIVLDGVREATELRNDHVTVWMLDFAAAFAAPTHPERAVRLAGAVDALRMEAGGGIVPASLEIEDARTVASRLIDTAVLEQAWTEGRDMSLAESVGLAYALGDEVVASHVPR